VEKSPFKGAAPSSSRRRGQRKRGQILTRTVPLLVPRATELSSGQLVPGRLLRERVGWLQTLVADAARTSLAAHWDDSSINDLVGGAQFAYKQLERTLGLPTLSPGVVAPSRVRWLAGEIVGRTLRSSAHRRQIVRALLADDLSLLPAGSDAVSLRNQRRRLNAYERDTGTPAGVLFDLEPGPPRVTPLLPLAAADRQLCTISSADSDGRFTLDVYLPAVANPASYADWLWHRITLQLPAPYRGRTPCRPTLRLKGQRLLVDVPLDQDAPEPLLTKGSLPLRVLSGDWGVNTLMTATLAWRDESGQTATDGRPLRFDATPLQTKAYRLHDQINSLSKEIDKRSKLLGVGKAASPEELRQLSAQGELAFPASRADQCRDLLRKHAELWQERELVSSKLTHLNQQIAHLAARWLVEQALALGVEAIVLEDLATLEAGGLGKRQNKRISLQVRGLLLAQVRAKAEEVGPAVILVKARGTSSHCPRCGGKGNHVRASNDSRPGYAWMSCPNCGHQADRDHSSSERIAQRALTPKAEKVRIERQPRRQREQLDSRTIPQRGPSARHKREHIVFTQTQEPSFNDNDLFGPCARSAACPPQPPQVAGHRSAGTLAQGLTQPRLTSICRPVRRLDGMRSAYKEQLSCTPVRISVYPAARAVTTGWE
jgi:IS605 OrfB family transposase